MIDLWIPITVAAAFSQNLRSALQKHLKSRLSTGGATYVRFLYAAPLAVIYALSLHVVAGLPAPVPSLEFAVYGAVGGLAQIAATALLVALFSFRNFSVGTTYSKTETVQAALFGLVILGDTLTPGAIIGILISLAGVMAISMARQERGFTGLLTSITEKSALIGIMSGAMFGISAVSYRAAALSLGGEGFLMQAAFTLACVTLMQTAVMTVYLAAREPGELGASLRNWKTAGLVGVSGVVGSACWFTAMTIQNVAYVRALGQIELVFTFAASYIFFKERLNLAEFLGILAVVAGIVVLLIGR